MHHLCVQNMHRALERLRMNKLRPITRTETIAITTSRSSQFFPRALLPNSYPVTLITSERNNPFPFLIVLFPYTFVHHFIRTSPTSRITSYKHILYSIFWNIIAPFKFISYINVTCQPPGTWLAPSLKLRTITIPSLSYSPTSNLFTFSSVRLLTCI